MADKRMFTKKITDDDHFSQMAASAQALYLHLSMSADDDGFCNQVSTAMFKAHASVSDLELLLQNRYIYQFENGVIVIKHWRMANALRKDRYTQTAFKEELAMLSLDENGAYTMSKNDLVADWLPNGCQVVADWLPQDSIGKNSIGKVNECSDELLKQNNNQIEKQINNINKYGIHHNITLTDEELSLIKSELSDYCGDIPSWQFYLDLLSNQSKKSGKVYGAADIIQWYRDDKQKGWRTFTAAPQQASYNLSAFEQKAYQKPVYKRKPK